MIVTIEGLAAEKARAEDEKRTLLDSVSRELESDCRPQAEAYGKRLRQDASWNSRAIAALVAAVERHSLSGDPKIAGRAQKILRDFDYANCFRRIECTASVPDNQRCRGLRPKKLPRHHGVSLPYARRYMAKQARADQLVVDVARKLGYLVVYGTRACQSEEEAAEARKIVGAAKLKGCLGLQSFVVRWANRVDVVVVLVLPADAALSAVSRALDLDQLLALSEPLGELYASYWRGLKSLGPERAVEQALARPKGQRLFRGKGCFAGKRRKALLETAAGLAKGAELDGVRTARSNAEAAADQAEQARVARDPKATTLAASFAAGWAREAGLAVRSVPTGVAQVAARAIADVAMSAARAARRSRTRANKCTDDGVFRLDLEAPPELQVPCCRRHGAELRLVGEIDVGEHGEHAVEVARWRNLPVGPCRNCGGDLEVGDGDICAACWERM